MRIIIPLGRSLVKALEYLEKEYKELDLSLVRARKEREYIVKDAQNEYIFIKPKDIMPFCKLHPFDLALTGSDVYLEDASDMFERVGSEKWGSQRLSLILHEDVRDCLVIYTPYVNLARKNYPEKQVIQAYSSLEIYPCLDRKSGILDIVETGKTMRMHNLAETDTLFDLELVCFKKRV